MTGNKKETVTSIQVMRGLASLLVVIAHTYIHLNVRGHISENGYFKLGKIGVDIFFVISGFIMVYITWNRFGESGEAIRFLMRRFIRIVPLYWIYTIFLSILLISVNHMFSDGKYFDITHFIKSLLFIPTYSPIGQMKPVLPVGWTLNYEIMFYLLFAVALLMSIGRGILFLSGVLSLLVLLGYTIEIDGAVWKQSTSPLLVEFLVGCGIAVLIRKGIYLNTSVATLFIILSIILVLSTVEYFLVDLHRAFRWGLASSIIVYCVVSIEKARKIQFRGLLSYLGDMSYSLYLSHIFSINLVGFVWGKIVGGHYSLFILVAVCFSVLVGHISYQMMEKPIINYFRNRAKIRTLV